MRTKQDLNVRSFTYQKGIERFLFYFLLMAVIMVPRWYYVENFALALPFWDQWDGEGEDVIRPWIEGHFQLSNLWRPHNEHRIFPTRILTLVCFVLTGVWSNLNEARLNVIVAAAIPLFLIWLMRHKKQLYGLRWFIIPVIVSQFVLPFGWENTLIGFQSQFFFLVFFALSGLALAAFRPDHILAFAAVFVLCILSVLTMASGLLMPLAVCCIYILHAVLNKTNRGLTLVFVTLLGLVAAGAYLILPYVKDHNVLHAANLQQFTAASIRVLSWPSKLALWPAWTLWLPALVGIPVLLICRRFNQFDLFMTGCFIWTVLQVFAISYGRGQGLDQMASRYRDLLTPGLVSASWFSVRLIAVQWQSLYLKLVMAAVALAFYITFFRMHALRIEDDLSDMSNQHKMMLVQLKNVSGYLKTHDISALDQPLFQIPYPNKERLQQLLDHKTYRMALPAITNEFKYEKPENSLK